MHMERHGEQSSESRHITEWSDIPPSPEAVFNAKGHIKTSYLKLYESYKKEEKVMDIRQAAEILRHTSQCPECKENLRKLRGDLPEGSLPF